MGTRGQAQRDAITVEIGYALVTAAFLAAGVFCLIGAPVLLLGVGGAAGRALLVAAGVAGCLAFVARVVEVLWGFSGTPGPVTGSDRAASGPPAAATGRAGSTGPEAQPGGTACR
ncbi:DUF6332 family protein [Streptomyces sp. NPDC050856]|uniref:DUF6332 family protein n=1 Tax=Streptomyces sp. NPDC050856 TaxID=3154939 RepID=UPI0033E3A871